MSQITEKLRDDALRIWQAGLRAVDVQMLVRRHLHVDGSHLVVGNEQFNLTTVDRIAVVGAGKASAKMAAAVEHVLGPKILAEKHVKGWVNVPADCVEPLQHIHLHSARPAGLNEPTTAGVNGTLEILRLVESLTPKDLCLCVLSGGGSALLPAPAPGISLEDKQAITRFLGAAGANIEELNTVRKQLSIVKGGGLARSCHAQRLISLVISDVPGDHLDLIASGPTVPDKSTPAEALEVLERFEARQADLPASIFTYLETKTDTPRTVPSSVTHALIGNNVTAVDAAAEAAETLGYRPIRSSAREPEGPAEEIGTALAETALRMRYTSGPNCVISGGEPTVKLAAAGQRGKGGRNQQLILAAFSRLGDASGIAILSGGTDGEDGPTDAAGALVDAHVVREASDLKLNPEHYLSHNDAYHFFEPLGALLKTGPTHTNVCDLRVAVVEQILGRSS